MKRDVIAVSSLWFIAFSIRLVPLTFSSLPYNIDGFALVRLSQDILSSGRWSIEHEIIGISYNAKLPVFSLILSTLSLVLGVDPLYFTQIMVPLITCTSILAFYSFVLKVLKNRAVAYFSSLFLALNGTYVFFTATAIKAAIAFALLPVILQLYYEIEDLRKRILCAFLLLLMPLIHHLSSLMIFGMITLLFIVGNVQKFKQGKWKNRDFALDFLLGPFLFVPGLWYYSEVRMIYFVKVSESNQIPLFLSIFFIIALFALSLSSSAKAGPWFFLPSSKKRIWLSVFDEKLLYPIGAIWILLANQYTNIFAGTLRTKEALIFAALPYILLILFSVVGFNLIRHTSTSHRPLAMSMILAPFSLMIFSFLRGLDPFSFTILYRSFDYLDMGIALCLGIGFTFIIRRPQSITLRSFFIATLFLLLLLTIPLGYNSEELYDVQNVTYEYELAGMLYVDKSKASFVGSDQRLYDTMNWYLGISGDGALPFLLSRGEDIGRYDFLFMEEQWMTKGAQRHPMGNIIIDSSSFLQIVEENELIYSTGVSKNNLYLVRRI